MNRYGAEFLGTFAAVLAAMAIGCATAAQEAKPVTSGVAKVTGTVTYLARVALPPTALVKVQLADVSRADAKAVVLGEQVIETKGRQVPFTFEVAYDPAKIVATHTYAIQARIEDGGQLRFVSDQRYAVITRGAPTKLDVVVKPVGGSK